MSFEVYNSPSPAQSGSPASPPRFVSPARRPRYDPYECPSMPREVFQSILAMFPNQIERDAVVSALTPGDFLSRNFTIGLRTRLVNRLQQLQLQLKDESESGDEEEKMDAWRIRFELFETIHRSLKLDGVVEDYMNLSPLVTKTYVRRYLNYITDECRPTPAKAPRKHKQTSVFSSVVYEFVVENEEPTEHFETFLEKEVNPRTFVLLQNEDGEMTNIGAAAANRFFELLLDCQEYLLHLSVGEQKELLTTAQVFFANFTPPDQIADDLIRVSFSPIFDKILTYENRLTLENVQQAYGFVEDEVVARTLF